VLANCGKEEASGAEAGSMLEVTPLLNDGRAWIRLRNGGKSRIVINILMWPECSKRPVIRNAGQLIHLPPRTVQPVDITDVALAMKRSKKTESVAVWMVFEVDPECQRFPVRYEIDICDGRVIRFIEQYPVH